MLTTEEMERHHNRINGSGVWDSVRASETDTFYVIRAVPAANKVKSLS